MRNRTIQVGLHFLSIAALVVFSVVLLPRTNAQDSVESKHAEFEKSRQDWVEMFQKIQQLQLAKNGKTQAERAQLDRQISEARKQADELVGRLVVSGLAVYQLNPNDYPNVSQTLFALADFHVLGDSRGDGGD